MASLRSCIGIHAAPPQVAAEIFRKMQDYKKSGMKAQDATERAIADVQQSMRGEIDAIHAQIAAARPDIILNAKNAQLTVDQQQLADLKAAGLKIAGWDDIDLNRIDLVSRVEKQLNGQLTKEEIATIIGTVESRYKFLHKRLTSDAIDLRMEFEQMGLEPYLKSSAADFLAMTPDQRKTELVKAELLKGLTAKKESIRHKWLSDKRDAIITQELDKIQAADGSKSRTDALADLLVGNIRGKGVVQSIEARIKGITDEYLQPLIAPLKPFISAVRGVVIDKSDYRDLARELIEPGSTGNAKVAKLADAMSGIMDTMRRNLNAHGANVQYLKGYIPQQWSRRKVMWAGMSGADKVAMVLGRGDRAKLKAMNDLARETWVDDMMDLVDRNHRAYVDAVTGEHFTDAQMRDYLGNAFDTLATDGASKGDGGGGGGTLANRLSSERSLFFKDADAFLTANEKYGQGDIFSGMMGHMVSRAKDMALMERMTPENFQKALAEAAKVDGVSLGGSSIKGTGRLESIWMELSGTRPTSGIGLVSDTMKALRSWQVFTKLGAALLSQPSDLATFSLMAKKDGLGFASSIREIMSALNPLNKSDRAIADDLGLATEVVYKDAGSRFLDATNDQSFVGKLARFTIKAGGMAWWANSLKRGFHILIGRGMARNKGVEFDSLDSGFRHMLERHGIDAGDWDVIRQSKVADINGREVLAPSSVKDAKVRGKLSGLFADEADYGVIEPGARERSLAVGKTEAGTLQGESIRSMTLFKMFSISMLTKTLPRLFTNLEGNKATMAGTMAAYALAMVGMGAFSTQLKELHKGRNLRDMTDPKFWIAALGQSGGLGIFSDFIFGDVNRMGQSIGQTLAGPLAGTITDAIKLTAGNVQELAQGKPTKAAAETLQFVKNNALPNLWYTKQAIDALLFNRAIEAVNPGYLQRMQSRVERENNTTFWWKPGDLLPSTPPDFTKAGGR